MRSSIFCAQFFAGEGFIILRCFRYSKGLDRSGKGMHQRRSLVAPRLLFYGGAFTIFISGFVLFVVLRAANKTAPDISFRAPPRGATACRKTVFLLLTDILASLFKPCRTRIIERGKIIPRKFLQPNNWQKISPQKLSDAVL